MPTRNTDKLPLKSDVEVRICRREGSSACEPVGGALMLLPGKGGNFDDALPSVLASGSPRPLRYFVELMNRKGRSAGLSNEAVVPAGQSPSPIEGLHAEVHKDGVILTWNERSEPGAVRLQRKLLTPLPAKPHQELLAPPQEPSEENLIVDTKPQVAGAVDRSIRLGESYEYRAQRVSRISYEGKPLELASEFSAPLRVNAEDMFPPAVPIGLAAVATTRDGGIEAAIDLSWQPDTEPDLAGYIVYRSEGDAAWQRISPAQPLVGPCISRNPRAAGPYLSLRSQRNDQGGHESRAPLKPTRRSPTPDSRKEDIS